MSKLFIEETTLTAIGDAIREMTGLEELIAPGNMPNEIRSIETGGGEPNIEPIEITANGVYSADDVDGYNPITVNVPQDGAPTDKELAFTGDFQYKFSKNSFNWIIEKYGNRITTKNLNNGQSAFDTSTTLTEIPFDLNFDPSASMVFMSNMFINCYALRNIGKISGVSPYNGAYLFGSCTNLRYLPELENWNWSSMHSVSYQALNAMFYCCYSLRSIPEEWLKEIYNAYNAYYGSQYGEFFYNCYSLDELRGVPVSNTANFSGNVFHNTFYDCFRLQNVIFNTDSGNPITVNWTNQAIDLSSVGWANKGTFTILNYNSGITADKEVKDAATYEALKEDPDWFSCDVAYSRYNHDSAVATINSLPSSTGTGNTIKFKGEAGSATDGGAINTLTEEEIAVAAAKGWTVTLV